MLGKYGHCLQGPFTAPGLLRVSRRIAEHFRGCRKIENESISHASKGSLLAAQIGHTSEPSSAQGQCLDTPSNIHSGSSQDDQSPMVSSIIPIYSSTVGWVGPHPIPGNRPSSGHPFPTDSAIGSIPMAGQGLPFKGHATGPLCLFGNHHPQLPTAESVRHMLVCWMLQEGIRSLENMKTSDRLRWKTECLKRQRR